MHALSDKDYRRISQTTRSTTWRALYRAAGWLGSVLLDLGPLPVIGLAFLPFVFLAFVSADFARRFLDPFIYLVTRL